MTIRRNLPLPEPSGGVDYYVAERDARLAFDPRTAENYRRYLEERHSKAKVSYLPIKLDVENVSRCNLRCPMCAVSTWDKGQRARDMTLAEFQRLIDEQYGLVEIKLNGLGEALMMGDAYFEMVRYARARRIWVRMTTNATLLHLHDKIRKLADSDVNEIDVSIDGTNERSYQNIRVGAVFNRVVRNALALNAYFANRGKTRTKMWMLVQRSNERQMERAVHFAQGLGFKHLVFSMNLHGWGDPALAERNRSVTVDPLLNEERAGSLVSEGERLGVRVSFWDVNEKFSAENRCPWPFSRAVVTSDLRTVPCCMIGNPDAYEIGKGETFLNAWNGAEYERFRQHHLDGDIPDICKGCYK